MRLTVLKRSGATEPFDRQKAISGARKACRGRPVTQDNLACLGQTVEDALRDKGWAEVPANEVGLAILGPLRALDEVAYLRFASVYHAFESAEDFEAEIAMLRAERSAEAVTGSGQETQAAQHVAGKLRGSGAETRDRRAGDTQMREGLRREAWQSG